MQKKLIIFLKNTLDKSYFDSLFARKLEVAALLLTSILVSTCIVFYAFYFSEAEALLRYIFKINPLWIFIIAPLALTLAWLIASILAPGSGGSGIPQILASIDDGAINGQLRNSKLLSVRVALFKMIGSIFAVFGGGAIGREGPSLHVASSLYYSLYRFYGKHFPAGNPTHWVIAGSASGLAAAFNTPLGGIMYAIEEMGHLHFPKIKTQLLFSIFIAGIVSQSLVGPYLYVGSPTTADLNLYLLMVISLIALFNGYFAAFLAHCLYKTMKIRNALKSFKWQFSWVLIASLLIATIVYFDFDSMGSGKEYISKLLFEREHLNGFTPILRVLNNFISYSIGLSGGVFAPALAAGAGFGYFISDLFQSQFSDASLNLIILVGMISFLVGFTRSPLTSFVLVLEMTNKHINISALMWGAIVSFVAARLYHKQGFYELSMTTYKIDSPQNKSNSTQN